MRNICVVTAGRSDYGIYRPVLRAMRDDPRLHVSMLVTGMHFSPEFGMTVQTVEADGFEIADRVDMLLATQSPEAIAKSMGVGVMGFAQVFARQRPDILLVLGDRFEMYASVLAALPFRVPVAHIHGGELTEGAIDDALRHSITKLSHLHFVATQEYARRVVQLGEEPWRVTLSGAPSLDNLDSWRQLDASELEERFDLKIHGPTLLVTYHPVTLEYEQTEAQTQQLLGALGDCDMPIIFTAPNADTSGQLVRRLIEQFVQENVRAQLVENLGTEAYFSLMALASAMVGNSSSGLIEAPSFRLPVVNIGNRQRGRVRATNVIDVGCSRPEIAAGINKALSADFCAELKSLRNPYGDGNASVTIAERLATVVLSEELTTKRFHDLPS